MPTAEENRGYIECWNQILTPKWLRFRHLLSGNGQIHSDRARETIEIPVGGRVLDIGCGFGETCLELAKIVGPSGEVVGIDCTEEFMKVAEVERQAVCADNVHYVLADAQTYEWAPDHFDLAFSRFGIMFFESAVRALRSAHRALKPGGLMAVIVWRSLADNPAWAAAKEVTLRHLPPPGDGAATCGPGPFSMASEETDRQMFAAAGFANIEQLRRIDVDICIGTSLEEAIDYQIMVGPSGEIVREAGELAKQRLSIIRDELAELFSRYQRGQEVWMPSSSWLIVARKA